MSNPIKRIMDSKYKFLFVGLIIILVVFCVGAVVINNIDLAMKDQQISYTDFTVTDKYVNGSSDHYYVVLSDSNDLFDIKNDSTGTKIFKSIQIGEHYNFVVQDPINEPQSMTHIIQVYNDTN